METKFWLEEKSLKQIFKESVKDINPNATLWDVFTDYSPIYNNEEPANTNKKLVRQTKKNYRYNNDRNILKQSIKPKYNKEQSIKFLNLDKNYSNYMESPEQRINEFINKIL